METITKDFIVPMLSIVVVCLACLVFAGFIVQAHEHTIQTCIKSEKMWVKSDCIVVDYKPAAG